MIFKSMEQNQRFTEIKADMPAHLRGDRELVALAIIMASSEALKTKMAPYVDWDDGFDYETMFENETFSPPEEIMAKVAVSLYDKGTDLQFVEVFIGLDETAREIALQAAHFRYNKRDPYEPEEETIYIK